MRFEKAGSLALWSLVASVHFLGGSNNVAAEALTARSVPPAVQLCTDHLKDATPTMGRVWLGDARTICYGGQIDREGADRFLEVLAEIPEGPVDLVVRSLGGQVEPALEMGEALRARGYSIHVSSSCVSSCANYLFLPAAGRSILADSYVMFHGGMTPGFLAGLREQLAQELRKRRPDVERVAFLQRDIDAFADLRQRERALYSASGVDPEFMRFFDDTFNALRGRAFRDRCQGRRLARAVVFSDRFLAERGVQIDLNLGPRTAEELVEFWVRRGGDARTMDVCWWD